MANQKTTDLRRMLPGELAPGDLFPVVDVSEATSPSGENKKMKVEDFATYVYENYTPRGGRFTLSFSVSHSGFLQDVSGSTDVFPPSYVLTAAVFETTGKPLISIGTDETVAPVGASITGSYNDNRVYPTSCSYDINYLEVSTYGAVHPSRKVWFQYSGSVSPGILTLDGFIR